ncbi:hypothetical protein JTE90_020518 [Oedothorax gibbosus]|uniref:Uncharacterized protein n=1 Tax=Oedothorax gibbosus TaxID=931172 RepID=A0AAV6TP06_9ARAC|nr:hypothetical protein JTE90_020518 [Oedothorax gibbosus]
MAKFGRMDEFVIGSSWKNYCQKLTFFFKANSFEDDTQKKEHFPDDLRRFNVFDSGCAIETSYPERFNI